MKRMILCAVAMIIMATAAVADAVVRMPYTLTTPDYIRDGLYTGETADDGEPQGYGVFVTMNDTGIRWHYIGWWVNGVMHGEGGTYWEDGACEVGTYDHGSFVDGYAVDSGATGSVAISATPAPTEQPVQYIGNRGTKRFHRPGCKSVNQMKQSNKIQFYDRDEAIALGYAPCGECNP